MPRLADDQDEHQLCTDLRDLKEEIYGRTEKTVKGHIITVEALHGGSSK